MASDNESGSDTSKPVKRTRRRRRTVLALLGLGVVVLAYRALGQQARPR